MAHPFSSYRVINAERIVKSNIRLDHIEEDATSLLRILAPLRQLSNSKSTEGVSLDRKFVKNLDAKTGVIDLLIYFGYVRSDTGEYVYQSAETSRERERRQNGVNEFKEFCEDLRVAQHGDLKGLKEFLRQSNKYSPSIDKSESDEETFPTVRDIKDGNIETLKLIKSLKESLVTGYSVAPSQNFIRRKIAHFSLKQKNRESDDSDDDSIDRKIDRKISSLKQKDGQTDAPRADQVYTECLIRGDFNEKKALEILRHHRPNLELPPEQTDSKTSTKISIDNLVEPLKQHCRLMNQSTRQPSRTDDKWENVKHIIPAIQKVRQLKNNTNTDDVIFSKMYRLLYSEICPIIHSQDSVKIEMFARMLCELPSEKIENLDINTIKNILSSSAFGENFEMNAISSLSSACPICMTSFPRNQMESMYLCNHMCCLPCLKNYYKVNIDRIQDVHSLTILTCFCEKHEITSDTHHNFFTYLDSKLKQWFPDDPELLRKYHDKIFNATSGQQIKKCGSSKCISSFYVDETIGVARFRCPHCQFAQCGQCCRKWLDEHTEMTCDEYMEWLIDNDPDDPDVQVLKYLRTDGIVCPNRDCQEIYQYKAGGCEHFTCDKCRTDFCRMCSVLFCVPSKNQRCSRPNCLLNNTIHAHCAPNCFRETRIGTNEAIIALLENNDIDVDEELEQKPVSTNGICPVEDCDRPTLATTGNRFCERCYQQFLCSLIWNHELEPWEIYEDNNLRQMLVKASVPVPEDATREDLIELCQENLNHTLGKPKIIPKPKPRFAND